MAIKVRKAHLSDFAAEDIRADDIREWCTASGLDPYKFIMLQGLGDYARTAVDENDHVLAVWGGSKEDDESGIVWLIATDRGQKRAIELHRGLKQELTNLHETFGDLKCYADSRNLVHLKWLGWLGFHAHGPVYYMRSPDVPYIYHSKPMEAASCVSQQ